MMQWLEVAVILIAVPAAVMTGAWWFHERTKQSGWIDVMWTSAVGLAGAGAALAGHVGAVPDRAWLYSAMAAAWGVRLALHLADRTRRAPDDPRYKKMRAKWGKESPRRMFGMLMFQAFAAAIPALAVAAAAHVSDGPISAVDIAAVVLFAVAWIGETLADAQMRAFRAQPDAHGRVMDTGLWAWSRHPNYFFEWLNWVAFALGAFAAPGWVTLLALPATILMFHLLSNVSGVPMLERQLKASKGAAWDAYAARVSRFFPWPPGNSSIADSR